MPGTSHVVQSILIDRVFLDLNNPRHEPFRTEAQVIDYLCKHEQVYQLARDIVKNGLNPLEHFAVIPADGRKVGRADRTYVVAEGNRRLCALKLLRDPERSPPDLRKDFAKLAENYSPRDSIPAVIFKDKSEVELWMDRIHGGLQGGVGRKDWDADQIQRFTGGSKNKVAQAVLDYAEAMNIISAADRKGKLTTVQRYLTNSLVKEALGIDTSNMDDISRNRPKVDFDLLLKLFIKDLMSGVVNSRTRKPDIDSYGRKLMAAPGQSGQRVEAESVATTPAPKGKKKPRPQPPKSPEKVRFISFEKEINELLIKLESRKLESLYYSICAVSLEEHTPLIAVGVWSFFESLTALAGRNPTTDFASYLSKSRLESFGLGDGKSTGALREAVERISKNGNTTKHHEISANFYGDQLANDMATLKDVILKCAEEALLVSV